ncbi:MAG: TRAP transporter small permease [Pseudomonadota bacterium]
MLARAAAAWAVAGGALLLAVVAVTTVNIGLFSAHRVAGLWGGTVSGLPGYEDFVRLAVSGAALMCFPYCQLRRGHVSVDLFAGRWTAPLVRVWDALTAALAVFLCVWMVRGMIETRSDGVLSPILGWPEWPFYLPGIVSLALWAAVAGQQAVSPGATRE